MKSLVVISKDWHKPEIKIVASKEDLSVSMDLNDFLDIVFTQAGSITWQFNNALWRSKVDAAAELVFDKMKEETIKVV